MMTREEFVRELRDALNHLRDPEGLRQSPLAGLLGMAERLDTFSALQRILTEAIEGLEPRAGEPAQSSAWRTYESLYYRYVQEFSQQEVAEQLGIGVRHLRREQRAALEVLADRLCQRFDLASKVCDRLAADVASPIQVAPAVEVEEGPAVNAELAWLREASPGSPTDLEQTLSEAVDLVQALLQRHQVRLRVSTAPALPRLAVHPVAVSQMLLNLLGVAIHRASGSQVHLTAAALPYEVEIRIRSSGPLPGIPPISPDDTASLDMARRIAALCGGRLNLPEGGAAFEAVLTLPALEQLPVLVIDDNADALQLLRRYTVGTRYRLVGTRDPDQALDIAREAAPQVIVLDVMMPQVDGWKVLGRLRQHPLTRHLPIVVCTILAQEELALSLGASAFLRKPVTQQRFLAALDQVVRTERGPD